MAFDLRKILIIFVIGILYLVFTLSVISAIYEKPDYSDFCIDEYYPKPYLAEAANCTGRQESDQALQEGCRQNGGMISYRQDEIGCYSEAYCEMCHKELEMAMEKYSFVTFMIASIMGVLAIVTGLFLKPEKNELHKWVGSGFLLGGLLALFVGTIIYYRDMDRLIRPFIILAELIIVIFVFYREMAQLSKPAIRDEKKQD